MVDAIILAGISDSHSSWPILAYVSEIDSVSCSDILYYKMLPGLYYFF